MAGGPAPAGCSGVVGGGGHRSYRSGGCGGMWRGESRGGPLPLLLYLPEPPPRETGGGRPLEAGRSGAQRPECGEGARRSSRTGGGAGRPGVETGRAHGGEATAVGDRGPRDPRGRGQRAACAPVGSRRGPRGPAPPSGPRRRRSIFFLLGGPGPRRPSQPCFCRPGLPTRPLVAEGWEPRVPRAPGPRRCVFMNSTNGALTAHTKPFLLRGRAGVGEGLADWNGFSLFLSLFFLEAEKFEFENEMNS